MNKILYVFLISLLIPLDVFSSQKVISKKIVVQEAMMYNPTYRSSIEDSSAEFYRYLGSYSVFMPVVSVGYDNSNTKTYGDLYIKEVFSIKGSVNIFDGLQSVGSIRNASLSYGNAQLNEKLELLNLIRDVNAAYNDLLKTEFLLNSSYSSYESAELLLNEALERQSLDIITKADLYKAMADKEKAYSTYLDAQTNYSNAVLEIARLSGMQVTEDTVFMPDDEIYFLLPLEEYVQAAMKYNPDLQKSMNLSKISDNSYMHSYGRFMPSVDINAGSSWDKNEKYNQNYVGLSVSWNIFSGFSDAASTLSKAKTGNSYELKVASTRDILIKNVHSLWLTAQSNEKKVVSAQLYLKSAEESYTSMLEMFRLGRASLKDTVDARATLEDAQTTLAHAQYTRAQTYSELMVVTGGYFSNLFNQLYYYK